MTRTDEILTLMAAGEHGVREAIAATALAPEPLHKGVRVRSLVWSQRYGVRRGDEGIVTGKGWPYADGVHTLWPLRMDRESQEAILFDHEIVPIDAKEVF
jgi:hypothetical protein